MVDAIATDANRSNIHRGDSFVVPHEPSCFNLGLGSISSFTFISEISLLAKMSLPGLELSQPSEERQTAVAPPSQIVLHRGSEWRFEVAFGHVVRVKVRL